MLPERSMVFFYYADFKPLNNAKLKFNFNTKIYIVHCMIIVYLLKLIMAYNYIFLGFHGFKYIYEKFWVGDQPNDLLTCLELLGKNLLENFGLPRSSKV